METQYGSRVLHLETIGPDAIPVRALLARVVRVQSALHRVVRKPRIIIVPLVEVVRTAL